MPQSIQVNVYIIYHMVVIILYLFVVMSDVFIRVLARSNVTVLQRVVYVCATMCTQQRQTGN